MLLSCSSYIIGTRCSPCRGFLFSVEWGIMRWGAALTLLTEAELHSKATKARGRCDFVQRLPVPRLHGHKHRPLARGLLGAEPPAAGRDAESGPRGLCVDSVRRSGEAGLFSRRFLQREDERIPGIHLHKVLCPCRGRESERPSRASHLSAAPAVWGGGG